MISNIIRSITQKYGNNNLLKYYYSYDESGNIASVSETTDLNESFEEYRYDFLNQLTSVLDNRNNTYTSIIYDEGGNIEQVVKSNYDTVNNRPTTDIYRNTYTYGDNNWKDKLTTFNNQTITYDAIGNPLQYRDGLSFKWENGRQLHSVTQNNAELQMKYDSNGLRTQKGNVHYYYDSDNNLIAMVSGNSTLLFYYDESGNITSFSLGGNMYFYVKNLQGDIVNIADSNGTVLVRYDYDVFGKITRIIDNSDPLVTGVEEFALLNPLRYRGYVYDDETGLYYLQSRYYDPVTGRFLNADVYADTGSGSPISTNMFAYCENMNIARNDSFGYSWKRITLNIYQPDNMSDFNCYSFALGFNYSQMKPGTRGYSVEAANEILNNSYYRSVLSYKKITLLKEPYSLNKIYDEVKKDLKNLRISWRTGNKDTKLRKGEYMIAMRVATFFNKATDTANPKRTMFSGFHFMKRDPKTGYWWEKASARGFVRNLGKINPDSDKNWKIYFDTLDSPFSRQMYYLRYRDFKRVFVYYNSSTKYLIIKKTFKVF